MSTALVIKRKEGQRITIYMDLRISLYDHLNPIETGTIKK